jgi:hypothetical protein
MHRFVLAATLVTLTSIQLSAQELPATSGDPTVIGQVEHEGYALVGSRGRFYVFGGLAMADYTDSAGTRRIVTLQHEDQIQDEKHVYYRELREGHRWAFSRQRGRDGQFGVWVQLAAREGAQQPKWQSFQRARLESPREGSAIRPTPIGVTSVAGCCGR